MLTRTSVVKVSPDAVVQIEMSLDEKMREIYARSGRILQVLCTPDWEDDFVYTIIWESP